MCSASLLVVLTSGLCAELGSPTLDGAEDADQGVTGQRELEEPRQIYCYTVILADLSVSGVATSIKATLSKRWVVLVQFWWNEVRTAYNIIRVLKLAPSSSIYFCYARTRYNLIC